MKRAIVCFLSALACTTALAQSSKGSSLGQEENASVSPFAVSVQFLERLGCQQRKAQSGSSSDECDAAEEDLKEAARRANGVVDHRVQKRIQEDGNKGTIRWRTPYDGR